MADPVDPTQPISDLRSEISGLLNEFKNLMSPIVQELSKIISDAMKKTGEEGGRSITDWITGTVAEVKQDLVPALQDSLADAFGTPLGDDWLNSIRTGLSKATDLFAGTHPELNIDLTKVTEGIEGLAKQFSKSAGDLHFQDVIIAGLSQMRAPLEQLLAPLDKLQQQFTKIDGPASELFSSFSNGARSMNEALQTLNQNVASYRTRVADAALATGEGFTAASQAFASLAHAGISPETILSMQTLHLNADNTAQSMSGLTAAMLIAKATGTSVGEVGQHMSTAMRTLGVSGEDAIKMFGVLKTAQEGTNLSFQQVSSEVMGGADTLKFFGNNVESAAAIYQNFIKTLSASGQTGLAGALFNDVVSGIERMDTGFRAFIGMTGKTGNYGAGGAVGSALRVEQAISTGNLEGILGDLKTTITNLTGAPILSRQGAIDSGQEQTFFMQREILGQALGVHGEQATRVMEMVGNNQKVGVDDIRAGGAANLDQMTKGGQEVINRQTTALQQMYNDIDTLGVDAMTRMSGSVNALADSADAFIRGTGKDFADFFRAARPKTGTANEENAPGLEEKMRKQNATLPGDVTRMGSHAAAMGMDLEGDLRSMGSARASLSQGLQGDLTQAFGSAAGAMEKGLAGTLPAIFDPIGIGLETHIKTGAAALSDAMKNLPMNTQAPKVNPDQAIRATEDNRGASGQVGSNLRLKLQDDVLNLKVRLNFEGSKFDIADIVADAALKAVVEHDIASSDGISNNSGMRPRRLTGMSAA